MTDQPQSCNDYSLGGFQLSGGLDAISQDGIASREALRMAEITGADYLGWSQGDHGVIESFQVCDAVRSCEAREAKHKEID